MTKEDKALLYHQRIFGFLLFFRKERFRKDHPTPYRQYLISLGKKTVDSMSTAFIKKCIDQNGRNLKSTDNLWLAFF